MPSTLQLQRILYQAVGSVVGSLLVPPSRAPVLDVQTTLGSDEASLTWSASNRTGSPGFGYKVELDIDGGGFNEIANTTNLFYTDTQGSAAGETYTYRITPFNDYGEGPSSNEAGVVLPGESEGPVLTGPDSAFDTNYTLTWSAVAGATSYDLYYSRDDTTFTFLANTAALEYEVTFDFPGMYHYVVAKNGAFESAPSNTHFVQLLLPIESSSLAINAGGGILLNAGGTLLIN
jgi:hypothetical protein